MGEIIAAPEGVMGAKRRSRERYLTGENVNSGRVKRDLCCPSVDSKRVSICGVWQRWTDIRDLSFDIEFENTLR